MHTDTLPDYGTGDATYKAAGEEAGIRRLVDCFNDIMGSNQEFQRIWSWHPDNKAVSRDKLARFLCAWTGGPRLYNEKYGPISIPKAHQHLAVTETERDQWLACMAQALAQQPYPQALRDYLLTQLAVPANRIVQLRQQQKAQQQDPHPPA